MIGLPSEIHELSKGLGSLSSHESPFLSQLLQSTFTEGARLEGRGLQMSDKLLIKQYLFSKEIAIISFLQIELHI